MMHTGDHFTNASCYPNFIAAVSFSEECFNVGVQANHQFQSTQNGQHTESNRVSHDGLDNRRYDYRAFQPYIGGNAFHYPNGYAFLQNQNFMGVSTLWWRMGNASFVNFLFRLRYLQNGLQSLQSNCHTLAAPHCQTDGYYTESNQVSHNGSDNGCYDDRVFQPHIGGNKFYYPAKSKFHGGKYSFGLLKNISEMPFF